MFGYLAAVGGLVAMIFDGALLSDVPGPLLR
jgi:hypothetical protein